MKISENEIKNTLKIELSNPNGGVMSANATEAIRSLVHEIAGKEDNVIAKEFKSGAVIGMVNTLNIVSSLLNAGIMDAAMDNQEYGWKRLSMSWLKQKRKVSRNLYWRNTGSLALGFRNFVTNYSRDLKSAKTTTRFRSLQVTYGKRSFKYSMTLNLPAHADDFITKITRDSFISGKPYVGLPEIVSKLDTFRKIGELEGTTKTHRPFIARMFAAEGQRWREEVEKAINRAAKS